MRLEQPAPEALLYAALELRLGIEARYHDYLDAAEEVAALRKRGWQVSQLAKDIERVFRTGEKIASFQILAGPGQPATRTLLYTPVPRRARQIVERLGDYLHFTPRFAPLDDKWRNDLRQLIEEGVAALAFATTGTLLAPPLLNRATGQSQLLVELIDGESVEKARTMLGQPGESVHVRVDYIDRLPDNHAA